MSIRKNNMNMIIFDTETNSLDTENGFIQELAWVIVDTSTWRTIKAVSHLIRWNTSYQVEPGAFAATGLTKEFCEYHGHKANNVFHDFLSDVTTCNFISGHNVLGFDLPMLASNVQRACLFPLADSNEYKSKLVVDTLIDLPYPPSMKVLALKYLALDHGYILSDAHQAMTDVFACKHLLTKYDFNQVLEIANTPLVTLTAKIDFNDLDSRDRIKNARFYWNSTRKLWEKRIRQFHLPNIQLTLGDNIKLFEE